MPCTEAKCASHSSADGLRAPLTENHVPTSSPASAAAALAVDVTRAGMPEPAAMLAASTLVTMPPVPDAGLAGAADVDAVQVLRAGNLRESAWRRATAGRRRAESTSESSTQRVGADQVRHKGGEPVVVAEADLVRGHGVVLVDHGDDAEVQQPVQRAEGVGVLAAAHEVLGGQEHLADGDAVGAEGVRVAGHQQALAHAGGGLLGGEVAGTLPRPSGASPAAMAPEDTRMISVPALRLCARASARSVRASSEIPPLMDVSEDEPTLTTMRRAPAAAAGRGSASAVPWPGARAHSSSAALSPLSLSGCGGAAAG